jgi:general secretion pathway protein C
MDHNSPMFARLSSFLIWAFVAGAAMFWGLRLWVRPSPVPASMVAINDTAGGARADWARLWGSEDAPAAAASASAPPESSRFKLIGVMAGKPVPAGSLTPGLALIAVDGKPPRAFASGGRIDEQLVLQTLSLRTATIGPVQGPASFVLEMTPLVAAATGTLPAPAGTSPQFPPAAAPPSVAPPIPEQPAPTVVIPPSSGSNGDPANSPPSSARQRRALVGGRNVDR